MKKYLLLMCLIPSLAFASPLNDIQQLEKPCKKEVVRLLLKYGYIGLDEAKRVLHDTLTEE